MNMYFNTILYSAQNILLPCFIIFGGIKVLIYTFDINIDDTLFDIYIFVSCILYLWTVIYRLIHIRKYDEVDININDCYNENIFDDEKKSVSYKLRILNYIIILCRKSYLVDDIKLCLKDIFNTITLYRMDFSESIVAMKDLEAMLRTLEYYKSSSNEKNLELKFVINEYYNLLRKKTQLLSWIIDN